jgi:hypothetical protein
MTAADQIVRSAKKSACQGGPSTYEFSGKRRSESWDSYDRVIFYIPSGFYAEGAKRHLSPVANALDIRPGELVSLKVFLHLQVPLLLLKRLQPIPFDAR